VRIVREALAKELDQLRAQFDAVRTRARA